MQGCGRAHHTLIHFAEPKENLNQETVDQNIGVNQNSVPDQGTLSTVSSAASDSCDVFLQIIPVKVISNSGNQITTYGLIDSGSDIIMIDPSIVKLLKIEGGPSKLTFTTVNNADREEGVKVNFKIAPVDNQNDQAGAQRQLCMGCERSYDSSKTHKAVKICGTVSTFTASVLPRGREKENFHPTRH